MLSVMDRLKPILHYDTWINYDVPQCLFNWKGKKQSLCFFGEQESIISIIPLGNFSSRDFYLPIVQKKSSWFIG